MKRPEQGIQRSIIAYLKATLPHGWLVIGLNNNPRSKIAGAIGKSMGCVAGLPDVMVLGRDGMYSTFPRFAFIEVKADKGRVSPVQQELHDKLIDIGCLVGIARSIDDARALCRKWGLPIRDGVWA